MSHIKGDSSVAARSRSGRKARWVVQALLLSLLPVFTWAGPVDINKADAATLAKELNGIGMSRAQAIVAYREKNGSFKSAEDLMKIKGIGAKVVEANRANIRLERAPAGTTKQPD